MGAALSMGISVTNDGKKCNSSMDAVNGLRGWDKFDLQKAYDLLAELLSEDQDYKIKFTIIGKKEE